MADLDLDAILALNEANVSHLSRIDAPALRRLIDQAFHVGVRGGGRDAFLIALDQSASYDSPNFRWFKGRLPRFVYVDRVVVAQERRGRGLARDLYEELFGLSLQAGHDVVTCEIHVDPPNPVSDKFHDAIGFEEIGRAVVYDSKTVRYLVKRLS